MKKYLLPCLALALAASPHFVRADGHHWTGLGTTAYWSNPANWQNNQPPAAGETPPVTVNFPAGSSRLRNTNNIVGLVIDHISLHGNGYNIHGSGAGASIIAGTHSTIFLLNDGTNTLGNSLTVTLNGNNTFDIEGHLTAAAHFQGSGALRKINRGTLRLAPTGPNSYSGGTLASAGQLILGGRGELFPVITVPGPLMIGMPSGSWPAVVLLETSDQIADNSSVTVHAPGTLNLWGSSEAIGSLSLHSGNVTTINGTNSIVGSLALNGGITYTNDQYWSSLITGRLSLNGADRTIEVQSGFLSIDAVITHGSGTAGLVKTGEGTLQLHGANLFNGFTRVNNGTLALYHPSALGTIANGTMVASNASLELANIVVGNEALTLSGNGFANSGALRCLGTNSWSGNLLLQSDAWVHTANSTNQASRLTLTGVVSGPGSLVKTGEGVLLLAGSANNSFTGGARLTRGTLLLAKTNAVAVSGSMTIGDDFDEPYSQIVRLLRPDQIADTAAVAVNKSGLLTFEPFTAQSETIGSLSGGGNVDLVLATLTTGGNNSDTTFTGIISGGTLGASLIKEGTGNFTLAGTNSYTGKTMINRGHVYLNASQPQSAVIINANGFLHGSGLSGPITCVRGWSFPGDNQHAPIHGTLRSGNLTLDAFSNFQIDLAGTHEGVDYDQLAVSGTVQLNGATLHLTQSFAGTSGAQFVIIRNDGADPVQGTFAFLPEGIVADYGYGAKFRVSYAGGDGNDVVLTQVAPFDPPRFNEITRTSNGAMMLGGQGIPNFIYVVEANSDLNTTNWLNIGATTADGLSGGLQFVDPGATNFSKRFYRFLLP